MNPVKPKDFFEGSIHLLYAVVAAQGFLSASMIYLPITNLFTFKGAMSGIALIFVYFFLVTAWFGFFKSVKKFEHTGKKITIVRYGFGLLNVFILYYMISLTSAVNGTDYLGIFWLLPVFLGSLIFVHSIKYVEYKDYIIGDEKMRPDIAQLKLSIKISVVFFIIFLAQAFLYNFAVHNIPNLTWNEFVAWDPIFLVSSFIFTSWYRWRTWKEKWPITIE